MKFKSDYTKVNAQIFNEYLKTWGIRVNFWTDIDRPDDVIMDVIQPYMVNGYMVFDRPAHRDIYIQCLMEYDRIKETEIIILDEMVSINDFIWDKVFAEPAFKDIEPGIQDVCRHATAGDYLTKDYTRDEDDD